MKTKFQTFTGNDAEALANAHLDTLADGQLGTVETVWNVTDAQWNYTVTWVA